MRISDWSSDVCSSDLAAPLGGGTNLRMAQPQPTSRQGLRTNHRLSNRLAVDRINPALHTPYRKSMKLHEIVLNQTLRENAKYSSTNASLLNSHGFTRRPGLSGVNILRSDEHTSEHQSLMHISYAVFAFK